MKSFNLKSAIEILFKSKTAAFRNSGFLKGTFSSTFRQFRNPAILRFSASLRISITEFRYNPKSISLFLMLGFCVAQNAMSQDSVYARLVINKLCSKEFAGRGYADNGSVKAGKYIAKEMSKIGLKPLPNHKKYLLPFKFPVNLITACSLTVNGKVLKVGEEFIADPGMGNTNLQIKKAQIINVENLNNAGWLLLLREGIGERNPEYYRNFYIIDTLPTALFNKYKKLIDSIKRYNNVVSLKNKLTYSVSVTQNEFFEMEVLRNGFPTEAFFKPEIQINVKTKFTVTAQNNAAGYVKGTQFPDSFLVFTAHYDHLGKMGTAVFPGANDNAAGVAMLLDLAKYYVAHPSKYSIIFIGFAGEEAGLIGSENYVSGKHHDLKRTKFLLNLDLVGTGEGNSTVVNATIFKPEFALLDSLNNQFKYVPGLNKRGKAANSDHYYFTEKGVHAFFLYQSGPRSSYHDVYDVPSTLSLYGYKNTVKLFIEFYNKL